MLAFVWTIAWSPMRRSLPRCLLLLQEIRYGTRNLGWPPCPFLRLLSYVPGSYYYSELETMDVLADESIGRVVAHSLWTPNGY